MLSWLYSTWPSMRSRLSFLACPDSALSSSDLPEPGSPSSSVKRP